MFAILKREVKNYLKRPLFWAGMIMVILGVYGSVGPYLNTRYLSPGESIVNDYPDTIHEGEVYEGYVPSSEEQRRRLWEETIQESLIWDLQMEEKMAETVIMEIKDMDIMDACRYLEEHCRYYNAFNIYRMTAYRKGTSEEINSYLDRKLKKKPFSYYFSRKFADFCGLFMGFFSTVMLSLLFWQDTRKHTYELLHTKPVSAVQYVAGKILGGFSVCLIVLAVLNLVFWAICMIRTKSGGLEVRLSDFLAATCLYILPNMLMVVCVYCLISLLFKNPLPAAPFLILYMVYSNMGSRNAEGIYGYYGRPLAIMVRFPGPLFDTSPPPMVMQNQSFLVIVCLLIFLLSMQLWKRRRV